MIKVNVLDSVHKCQAVFSVNEWAQIKISRIKMLMNTDKNKKGDMVIIEPLGRSRWPEGFWDAFPMDPDFKTPEALPSENFSLD